MSKNYLGIITILICSLFLLPQNTYSSPKENDGLQEICGKRCEEIYRTIYNDGKLRTSKGASIFYDYKSHYNKKLNRCFLLINENSDLGKMKTLTEVNENKVYGTLRVYKNKKIMSCFVLDKTCTSEKVWDTLVKPYIENDF